MLYLFHAESMEKLEDIEDGLLSIQEDGFNSDSINSVFRAFHTIKGGAGMFELEKLVHLSHKAENILDKLRDGQLTITNEMITLLLQIKDHIEKLIDSIIQNDGKETYSNDLQEKTTHFEAQLDDIANNIHSVSTIQEITEPKVVEEQDIDVVNDTVKETDTNEDSKEKFDTAPEVKNGDNVIQNDKIDSKNQSKQTVQIKSITPTSTLKVEANRIDTLINLVGEMVITTASVIQHSVRINDKDLNDSVNLLSRMLEELRESSMRIRMVPIGDTFARFKRVVRDLSTQLNKDIKLVLEGGETELDKTVIEKISDPLIHLIRNSIDHGIENIEERIEKGKDKTATIMLKAFHEASSITIEVSDDGRGLNKEKILAKALEKGLVGSDEHLEDEQIFSLIMKPGFSTAQSISDLSGRGVGMDVVKRNIEDLRGTIDIQSIDGKGTTISIRLPLTLAIIDGFMIKLGGDFYIIPLEMLLECIELTQEYKEFVKENNFINLRGHVLPLLDLREFFGYSVVDNEKKKENIVIVNFGTLRVGLIVDELLGEFQTVIKPIGRVFQNLQGIGGATILGDGRVAAILDIPVLLRYANDIKK